MNNKRLIQFMYICFVLFIVMLFYFFSPRQQDSFMVFMILSVGFIFIEFCFKEKKKEVIIYDMAESEIVSKIKANDSLFSKDNFYMFVKNMVHFYYDACMGENLDKVKNVVGEEVFNDIKNIVDLDSSKKIERVVTDLEIKGLVLKNYYLNDEYEYIEVLIEYKKNEFLFLKNVENVNEIDSGRYRRYIYTFSRKIGSESKQISYRENCPGCGANNSNFVMGVCVRCGCMIGNYGDFILESIESDENEKK